MGKIGAKSELSDKELKELAEAALEKDSEDEGEEVGVEEEEDYYEGDDDDDGLVPTGSKRLKKQSASPVKKQSISPQKS